jgi:hypothetical protein
LFKIIPLKKVIQCFKAIVTVFIFGFLLLHCNDFSTVTHVTDKEFSRELSIHFSQGKNDINQEGIQKESISLKNSQNSNSNEIVRKQIPSFLLPTSLVQLELFNKNSFEVFFVNKHLLNLFFNTSRIIFPSHYFW